MTALDNNEAASPCEWNNLKVYLLTWTIQGNSNTEAGNIFYQIEAPTNALHLSSAIKPESISEGWKAVSSANTMPEPTLLSAFSGAWRSLGRAVPYFPSESKNFIKVEEGSDLLFANSRASFYPSHVWRANISIAKSLKEKKKKKELQLVSFTPEDKLCYLVLWVNWGM